MKLQRYLKRVVFRYLCSVFLISGAFSSLQAADLEVFVIKPPQVLLPNVQRIAVQVFVGANKRDVRYQAFGQSMAGFLTSDLFNEKRGLKDITGKFTIWKKKKGVTFQKGARTNIYTILDRDHFDKILEEHKKVLAGLVPEEYAIKVGELAGVQAFVVGNISYSFNDKRISKKKDGNKISGTERKVNTRVTVNMISTETGNVIASKTMTREYKAENYSGGTDGGDIADKVFGGILGGNKNSSSSSELWGVEAIVEQHLKEISAEFASLIAPTFELQKYSIENIKFNGNNKKTLNACAKKAKKLAKKGKIDDAYAIYASLFNQDQYNPKLNYNLGVLSEVVGRFEEASEYYQTAQELKENEKRYNKSVDRIEQMLEFEETLSDLNVEFEEHTWPEPSDCGNERWVQVTKDDCKIHESPSMESPVVTPIPKDVRLRFLADEGVWVLVKLPRGKQKGYIRRNMVKMLN